MRNEIKYQINKGKTNLIKNNLLINLCNEIYEQRQVNSLYYDTNDFKLYSETVNGIGERIKIRARYYNQGEEGYTLEKKIKKNDKNRKEYPKCGVYEEKAIIDGLTNKFNSNTYICKNLKLPSKVDDYYFPKTLVTYTRRYFVTPCRKYRITLDTNINFRLAILNCDGITLLNKKRLENDILEIKYESYIEKLSESLYRTIEEHSLIYSKNSKYASSIELIF